MWYAVFIAVVAQGQKLNGALPASGDVSAFGWAPEGAEAVYLADQDIDDVAELYSVALGASPVQTKLNEPLWEPLAGEELRISPIDGRPCLFLPGHEQVLYVETYVAPFFSSSTTYRASRSGSPSPAPYPSTPYSDGIRGTRVVYVKVPTAGMTTLWSAPIDAPISEVRLSPGLLGFTQSILPRQTADGVTTVFAYQTFNPSGPDVVWSVPTDGSAAAIALNATTNPLRRTRQILVHPSDAFVLYVADDASDDVDELWRVPIDASAPPVRLSQTLVAGGDVTKDVLISPDGARVAFRADADADEVFELYCVPVAGGTVVKLNGSMVAGGDMAAAFNEVQFGFSPDSAYVVYRADQDADEIFELYAARADGSQPAVKLHAPLAGSQDVPVHAFRLTPDSRAVFAADTEVTGRFELWSAPLDGSAAAVKLNPPMTSGGSLRLVSSSGAHDTLALAPGGKHAYYLADQDTDETYELYRVPTDGSASAQRCNGTLPAGGDVTDFGLGPTGNKVLYRADEDVDEVFELYLTEFPGMPRPTRTATSPTGTVVRSVP